jgi:Lrp/AsnC family transcriptional regulator, leucine-responsive regulatory protein
MVEIQLDGTDHEILALLTEDGRRTIADIAGRVSLSSAATKRRIDRLQRLGVILGYTTVVDYARLGWPLEAFTELRFAGRTQVEDIEATAAAAQEIQAVYMIAGDPDALVHIRAQDIDHLKDVIDRLRHSGKVTGTKTLMVLSTSAKAANMPPLSS